MPGDSAGGGKGPETGGSAGPVTTTSEPAAPVLVARPGRVNLVVTVSQPSTREVATATKPQKSVPAPVLTVAPPAVESIQAEAGEAFWGWLTARRKINWT